MERFLWIPLALLSLGLVLAGCPDQFSTPTPNDDDDDSADDDAGDDDAGDDDTEPAGPTPAEVQDALDELVNWPVYAGCDCVTLYTTDANNSVELKFTANIDPGSVTPPHTEVYDLPGPGAVLSLKAGFDMGTNTCGGVGNPETTDNYSVQSGSVTLNLVSGPMAGISFSNVELLRVGGTETVTIPSVTLSLIGVGCIY